MRFALGIGARPEALVIAAVRSGWRRVVERNGVTPKEGFGTALWLR